jgi:hypothetical protein
LEEQRKGLVKYQSKMNNKVHGMGGKIPAFDGKAKNFAMWWKKFLAYAAMSRFKDIY